MVKPERVSGSGSDSAKYKGVRKRKWGKWVSEIRLPNSRERIWLGSYDTPEKAARAFDAALFCLRGNTASFNFPHQPPNIPGGRSLPPSQIQAAAARFANENNNCADFQRERESKEDLFLPFETAGTEEDLFTCSSSTCGCMNYKINNINSSSCSEESSDHNTGGGVPDFGIYPGFDDYFFFMSTTTEEEREASTDHNIIDDQINSDNYNSSSSSSSSSISCSDDGIYLQTTGTGTGLSFLWNF